MKNLFPKSVAGRRLCSGIIAGAWALLRLFAGDLAIGRRGMGASGLRAFAASVVSFGPRARATISILLTALLFVFIHSTALRAATPAGVNISNTAAATYTDGPSSGNITRNSNSTTVTTVAYRTPATLELLQYAPASPGAQMVTVAPSAYSTSGTAAGPFVIMSAPVPAGSSTPLDLTNPVPLAAAALYHAGEPIFIRVTDLDQNLDPTTAETVLVTVRDDLSGDAEVVRLVETGLDTGAFVGYVPTTSLPAVSGNGVLSVTSDSRITASYADPTDNTDTSAATITADPLSKVLSSATGLPVNGAAVTLVNAATNLPAVVYGDDGVSLFPPTIVTGMTTTDSGGKIYSFPAGEYRFPFIPAGTYRLSVVSPAGYKAPSTVSTSAIQGLPGGPFVIADPASRGGVFTVNTGLTIHVDIPVDPVGNRLYLIKSAANTVAAVGDFLQYKLSVENVDTTAPVPGVAVNDVLPLGFRYRKGSTKINGLAATDPSASGDGRALMFTVGDIAAGKTADISYVTEVAAGAKTGMAVNTAVAAGAAGAVSNIATAAVLVKEDFFSEKAFIEGRVMVDGCGKADASEEGGLEGVRLFLEDGTYIVTDKNGMFHFEGVKPGTHVVQIDLETVPEKYEVLSCEENSRFAETAYSQFVDLQGGTLWRADFHLGLKPKITGETGVELRSALKKGTTNSKDLIEYSVPVHVGTVPLRNLRLTVMLPEGATYQTGSSNLNAVPQPEPSSMENALIFRLGDVPADWEGTVRFNAAVSIAGNAGELATKALLTFDTPQKKNERSPVADNLLVRQVVEERQTVPDIVLHPKFAVLSAVLSKKDKKALDRLIQDMKSQNVTRITVTGHTDSGKIKGRGTKKFKDNYALSQARAETVGRYIAAALKLSPEQVAFIGKGPDEPVAANKTEKGRAQNRRVELKVETQQVTVTAELHNDKESSGIKTVATTGLRPGEKWAGPETKKAVSDEKKMPEYNLDWLEHAEPGFAWLWPYEGFHPSIPSTKIAIKHDPGKHLQLFLNGKEVSELNSEGTIKRPDNEVAVSLWIGIALKDDDNTFEAVQYDDSGKETERLKRVIHYSGAPVKAELVPAKSKLVADGKNPAVIAVLLTDKDGHPVREGINGDYAVDPPYISRQRAEDLQKNPLTASTSDKLRYQVGEDGIAFVELQPTTRTGEAVIRFPLLNGAQEIRAWLTPEKRDWILVGLAEGTVGYNVVKGNMESASGEDNDLYKDGRVAFYAKGSVKGEWLLTIAYDSDKHGNRDPKSLYQTIDPNKYYTLYGDATDQRSDAASSRTLYLKIERDQFYALFGDYDTGLTITELSRYSRQFNGLKSEMKSDHFDFTLFASQNDQAFVKDEIQGDGTSGLYRLSRKNVIINSESVVIETRDRFKSEVILSSQPMSRYLDYTIDYDAGTIWFKSPVFSRDANFNPIFIVVRYELFDAAGNSYNYGGRGAVRVLNNRVELGATHVHEESDGGKGNLSGLDATVKLDDHTKIRTEIATSKTDEAGVANDGTAYLAEVSHQSAHLEGKAYVRQLEPGFGLGQQNNSEAGTRKIGYDLTYRMNQSFSLNSDAFRQENLLTDAVRNMVEVQGKYTEKRYELFGGVRYAEDTFVDGPTQTSDQIFVGGRYQMTDRLSVTLRHDQSLGNENANTDFPTRTTLGADYKLSNTATLYANQELTRGAQLDTATSRIGVRSAPWTGGQVNSTVEQQTTENGERLFSTLGLKQTWQVNKQWTVDAGLDRSGTIKQTTSASSVSPQQFNSNVPPASGGPDFTAVSLGAGYRAEKWSWTGRVEERHSDDEKKLGVFSGVNGEPREGIGLAAAVQAFQSSFATGARTANDDVRLGIVYRPKKSEWTVLDRLDFLVDERRDNVFTYDNWRIVNNLNTNYKSSPDTQIALQYACKYVRETIDDLDYRGYTDLTGLEAIHDVTKKWDIGIKGRMLHSWSADQYKYGTSLSLGYNLVKNVLIRIGYNITGFTDRDFSKADFTSEGPFIKLSLKFDQVSARSAVKWLTGQ